MRRINTIAADLALTGWSPVELSERSRIPLATVCGLRDDPARKMNKSTAAKLRKAMKTHASQQRRWGKETK